MARLAGISTNLNAFLDMLAWSEIGPKLLVVSDDGYNVIVGSTPDHPDLFQSYDDHPRKLVAVNAGLYSTAAGRYQILSRWFDVYRKMLRLPDFSPESQDKIAIRMMEERGILTMVEQSHFAAAVQRAASIWASLAGAGYGQHENALDDLRMVYLDGGGNLAVT